MNIENMIRSAIDNRVASGASYQDIDKAVATILGNLPKCLLARDRLPKKKIIETLAASIKNYEKGFR